MDGPDTPLRSQSRSHVSEGSRRKAEGRGQRVEWQGGAQARQYLERNNGLSLPTNRWVVIYTNNPPTPLQTNLFDLLGTNRALFYRVRAMRE